MKYLLNTNACIGLLKGSSVTLQDKVETVRNDEVVVPSVIRYEVLYGANKSQSPNRTLALLQRFLNAFPSLSFDDEAAETCGKVRAELEGRGTPIGPYDTMIAAIAITNDLILVARNAREFRRVSGLAVENWEE